MMVFDIEERVAKAKRLFKEDGYNCCQAVVLAYNDVFGIDDTMAAALSSSLLPLSPAMTFLRTVIVGKSA
jgi:hypothetical protein